MAHRDLQSLIHDLAGRLHEVVRFDHVGLVRHDAENNLMHRHVFDHSGPLLAEPPAAFYVEDAPWGLVLQTQQPLILSNLAEIGRWPLYRERVKPLGANSVCILPLTTARQRLGTLVFASKEQAAYDDADLDFLQRLAKQVAVAFENALAFDYIERLKEKLEKEKVYLEEEIRTDNNFEEIVGESVALRRVLKDVETVAPTDSTVLIHGETGTGKELIARALHQLSPSRQRTFVKLNSPLSRPASSKANCSVTRKAPSPAPLHKRSAASSWRTKGHCSWTRSVTSPRSCNPSYCASCRNRNSSAWAAPRRSVSACGWWRPPIAICRAWSVTPNSAATSFTA